MFACFSKSVNKDSNDFPVNFKKLTIGTNKLDKSSPNRGLE